MLSLKDCELEQVLNEPPEDSDLPLSEKRLALANQAPRAVRDISKFWKRRTRRQGEAYPFSTAPKVGRNASCPCGSGKKYKKCCL